MHATVRTTLALTACWIGLGSPGSRGAGFPATPATYAPVGVSSPLAGSPVPDHRVDVGATSYVALHVIGSRFGTSTGELVDGGLCDASDDWSGKIVLCERGAIAFFDKVDFVADAGGLAAVIYNNSPGINEASCGEPAFACSDPRIPAVTVSQEDGSALLGCIGCVAKVVTVQCGSPGVFCDDLDFGDAASWSATAP